MLTTFYISLPSVLNFAALTGLVLAIFAVLGRWLFFNVNLHQDAGEFMDENISYEQFDTAFFSLFRQVEERHHSCLQSRVIFAFALSNAYIYRS